MVKDVLPGTLVVFSRGDYGHEEWDCEVLRSWDLNFIVYYESIKFNIMSPLFLRKDKDMIIFGLL